MKKAAAKTVSYAGALGQSSADKRIEILRLIGQSGAISQAAREAGVSYKGAWQAIDTLTNLAGVALVERAVGGAGGGGASLSGAGVQLLAAAGQLEQARNQVLARLQQSAGAGAGLGANAGALPALNQLSVRTSMRNLLPCQVQSLKLTGQIVQVTLAFAQSTSAGAPATAVPGMLLVSRITRESAELLALQPGLAVLALCKATAVGVMRGERKVAPASGKRATANLLSGRATRVSRGETGDEVSLTLDGGLQLVGFAPAASGIRVGNRVQASVDEAAVVVALAG